MRTLRTLSTLATFAGIAALGAAACSSTTDKKGLDRAGSGGTGAVGAMGGTTMVTLMGGSSGSGGSSSGGTDSGTAAAAGDNGVAECGELAGLGKCGGTQLLAEFRTVNMLIVLDKSGSMDDQPDGFDQKKWAAMKSALATALGKVETQMNFGLVLYPYAEPVQIPLDHCEDVGNCCDLSTLDGAGVVVPVQPGTVSVDQINASLEQTGPGGGTPTAAALGAALDYFTTGEGSTLTGDNYVLLATDGGPNCFDGPPCTAERCTTNLDGHCDSGNCCGDAEGNVRCLDDDNVTKQLKALHDAGIFTFVVGIPGTEAYTEYLDGFADEGGVPAVGMAQKYYAVSADAGVEGLTGVFESITTQLLRDCDIVLPDIPSKLDLVNVAIDCSVVPQNDDDGISGWAFDQTPAPTSVIVHGPLCDTIQQKGAERVDVVFGCPTVR